MQRGTSVPEDPAHVNDYTRNHLLEVSRASYVDRHKSRRRNRLMEVTAMITALSGLIVALTPLLAKVL